MSNCSDNSSVAISAIFQPVNITVNTSTQNIGLSVNQPNVDSFSIAVSSNVQPINLELNTNTNNVVLSVFETGGLTAKWGYITGQISDQLDFQRALYNNLVQAVNVVTNLSALSGIVVAELSSSIPTIQGTANQINTTNVNNLVTLSLPTSVVVPGNINVTGHILSGGVDISLLFGSSIDVAVLAALSGNWQNTYNTVNSFSSNWQYAYNTVNSFSSNWQYAYNLLQNSSNNWQYAYDTITAFSNNWQNVYNSVNNLSSNWQNTYNSVNSLSSNWQSVYNTVNSLSSNWQSVYNNVNNLSGNWQNSYTSLQNLSGNWQSVYTFVTNNSSGWANATVSLPQSANWQSTYTTVCSNSANWNNIYAFLQNVPANSIIGNFNSLSGNSNIIAYTSTGISILTAFDTATAASNLGLGTTNTPIFSGVQIGNSQYSSNLIYYASMSSPASSATIQTILTSTATTVKFLASIKSTTTTGSIASNVTNVAEILATKNPDNTWDGTVYGILEPRGSMFDYTQDIIQINVVNNYITLKFNFNAPYQNNILVQATTLTY